MWRSTDLGMSRTGCGFGYGMIGCQRAILGQDGSSCLTFHHLSILTSMEHRNVLKVVVQPAACADLSGVVFSLSNPNASSHVTG